jgi:hypothetical protein
MGGKTVFRVILGVGLSISFSMAEEYYLKNNHKVFLHPLDTIKQRATSSTPFSSTSHLKIKYYQKEGGGVVGIDDTFIVKLDNNSSIAEVLNNHLGVKLVKKLSTSLYLLRVDENLSVLEIANSFNSSKGVVFSQPNFLQKRLRR